MTLSFASFIALLQDLEAARIHRATTEGRATNPDHRIIKEWFATHGRDIPRHGASALALLSCLLPERLPQRVYALRENRLSQIFGRALGLGGYRLQRLRAWQTQSSTSDFAEHVASIMAEAETSANRQLTIEDIDTALVQVAANTQFSGPKVKALRQKSLEAHEILSPIITCLRSQEAKWFIRLILKDFRTFQIPEKVLLGQFHFLLPDLFTTQPDLEAAIAMLSHEKIQPWPSNPDVGSAKALRAVAVELFEPHMGVMVARQPYDKARSIKHCVNLVDKQIVSVERKYDGEYCQIHLTRTAENDCIQIFSKSGKDSTDDREPLHRAIRAGLKLDGEDCKIQHRCILEGELLIWNSFKRNFEPFHKIRRYVKHGGRFLGIDRDSPQKSGERVMIMFYDILLLDEHILASQPHETRRKYLKDVVAKIQGVSDIGWRKLVDFRKESQGAARLRQVFATSIQHGWEGLVLKPQANPYYSWSKPCKGIKLKKDYLQQLGDTADLCIIGARRDIRVSDGDGWNTFYLACLENRETVQRFGGLPSFKVIDIITTGTSCIPPTDLTDLLRLGRSRSVSDSQTRLRIEHMVPTLPPTVVFDPPFVIECLGSGYDKNSNCNFWTLRFPRITKIHYDRGVGETMTFTELQEAAQKPTYADTDDDDVQEMVRRLIAADGKHAANANSTQSTSPGKTPRSATTASISPVQRRKPPTPPLFIRADSNELTSTELQQRRFSTQTTASTRTPSTVASKQDAPIIVHRSQINSVPGRLQSRPSMGVLAFKQPTIAAARPQHKRQLDSPPPSSPTPADRGKRRAVDVFDRNGIVGSVRYRLVESPQLPALQIDLTQSSPSSSPGPSRAPAVQISSATNQRRTRGARGLVNTPPWCAAPSTTLVSTAGSLAQVEDDLFAAVRARSISIDGAIDSPPSRTSRPPRLPLSELPPSSPQHTTSASKPAPLLAQQERPKSKPTDTRVTEVVIEERTALELVEDGSNSLITPPSTEEAARRLADTTREDNRGTHGSRPPASVHDRPSQTGSPRKPQDQETLHTVVSEDGMRGNAPILISESLQDHRCLHNLLLKSTAAFTYSRSTFIAEALVNPKKHYLVLIDTSDHAATAQEVWKIGSRAVDMLVARRSPGPPAEDIDHRNSDKIRLMFYHWRALRYLCGDQTGNTVGAQLERQDDQGWKQYFCCSIDVGGDVADEKGNAAGWVVWR